MKTIITLICVIVFGKADSVGRSVPPQTRRILDGKPVGETRPYMVYLRPALLPGAESKLTKWMCGGVIIHERYILTSAACIEDAKNFYVVSGTNRWVPLDEENECIKNGAKKAVWKCVPKDYFFDGDDFENIHWMSNDIAVVKVEDDFNFNKRVRGCEYIPKKISFNNVSENNEAPGTMGSIAGWGSADSYGDVDIARSSTNSLILMETDVKLISKKNCKKRWDEQYHHIIDESMICTKDNQNTAHMSTACIEQGINCKELEYADDYDEGKAGRKLRRVMAPDQLEVHGDLHHQINNTRRFKVVSGGFCENDHGGPLVVGHGATSMVVGIISACMTKEITKKCYGPYLYTSVWNNRHLISCAIDKDVGSKSCRKSLKTSKNQIYELSYDWTNHIAGGTVTPLQRKLFVTGNITKPRKSDELISKKS